MLIKEIKRGEVLHIGDATITLIKKSGQAARLCIDAPLNIPIYLESEAKQQQVSDKIKS